MALFTTSPVVCTFELLGKSSKCCILLHEFSEHCRLPETRVLNMYLIFKFKYSSVKYPGKRSVLHLKLLTLCFCNCLVDVTECGVSPHFSFCINHNDTCLQVLTIHQGHWQHSFSFSIFQHTSVETCFQYSGQLCSGLRFEVHISFSKLSQAVGRRPLEYLANYGVRLEPHRRNSLLLLLLVVQRWELYH